jgi:hypothetical protein
MDDLIQYLASLKGGTIEDTTQLENLLSTCGDDFIGSGETNMYSSKIPGRMEAVEWNDPILSFEIERHGATVHGSSRADIYKWELDIGKRTARCQKEGYKHLYKTQPRMNTLQIAEEIVRLITERTVDERLKWNIKTGKVKVLVGRIIPEGSAVKSTVAGRRKRFRKDLNTLLSSVGWTETGRYIYQPPGQKGMLSGRGMSFT